MTIGLICVIFQFILLGLSVAFGKIDPTDKIQRIFLTIGCLFGALTCFFILIGI